VKQKKAEDLAVIERMRKGSKKQYKKDEKEESNPSKKKV
jgi:hypothetical protein